MTDTVAIIVSIVGAAVGVIGVLGVMLRMMATGIGREFTSTNKRIDDLNSRINDTNARIDDTNPCLDTLHAEIHQGFEQVSRELGENRERMAKLEGSLERFLAGRRDRDAA